MNFVVGRLTDEVGQGAGDEAESGESATRGGEEDQQHGPRPRPDGEGEAGCGTRPETRH